MTGSSSLRNANDGEIRPAFDDVDEGSGIRGRPAKIAIFTAIGGRETVAVSAENEICDGLNENGALPAAVTVGRHTRRLSGATPDPATRPSGRRLFRKKARHEKSFGEIQVRVRLKSACDVFTNTYDADENSVFSRRAKVARILPPTFSGELLANSLRVSRRRANYSYE